MGKGDRKTAKGKRYNSSYGNARPQVTTKAAGTAAAPAVKKSATEEGRLRRDPPRDAFRKPRLGGASAFWPQAMRLPPANTPCANPPPSQ